MSLGMQPDELDREIERAIVRSFGWSIIDFEAVLYQKFLVLSAATSLMTEEMFRKHMMSMEAKGYVVPVDFQGKKAWKRLVIESDMDEHDMTPEEVREFLQQATERSADKEEHSKSRGERVVSESKALADSIIRILEKALKEKYPDKKRIGEPSLLEHIESMRKALAVSKEAFTKYVRNHFPKVAKDIERYLDAKGEEAILLSLRVIETGHRIYPPQ